MKLKFCTFYTPRYSQHMERLIASLERHGLDWFAEEVPEFDGGFLEAVRYKPQFILNCVEKFHMYDAIVWTDADSEFLKPPKLLFRLTCDVATRYRDCFEMLSGTMYWRVCHKVREFLPKWVNMMSHESTAPLPCPEQQVLQEMIKTSGLDLYRLPEEYTYVAPMEGRHEDALRERNNLGRVVTPVIYHHQASREMRDGGRESVRDV